MEHMLRSKTFAHIFLNLLVVYLFRYAKFLRKNPSAYIKFDQNEWISTHCCRCLLPSAFSYTVLLILYWIILSCITPSTKTSNSPFHLHNLLNASRTTLAKPRQHPSFLSSTSTDLDNNYSLPPWRLPLCPFRPHWTTCAVLNSSRPPPCIPPSRGLLTSNNARCLRSLYHFYEIASTLTSFSSTAYILVL